MRLFQQTLIPLILCNQLVTKYVAGPNPCTGELSVPHVVTPDAPNLPQFDRIIVLGDSLNDVSNLYTDTIGLLPNHKFYCKGRFSNGRVWVEFLHDLLEKKLDNKIDMINYAVGGATTNNKLGFVLPIITSLYEQVTTKLGEFKNSTGVEDFSNSLFTLWMGGNDYFLNFLTPEKVVHELEDILYILLVEEKIGHLVLGDHPPINRPLQINTPDQTITKTTMTNLHNKLLKEALSRVMNLAKSKHNLDPKVTFFRTMDYLGPILRNETDVPLFDKEYVTNKPCMTKMDRKAVICGDPDHYVFWDSDHPTQKTHRFFATEVFKKLVNNYL